MPITAIDSGFWIINSTDDQLGRLKQQNNEVNMSLSAAEKAKIVTDFGSSANDTGSVEVQIALLTNDINKLTEHFKAHAKDVHSRRGLIRKVNLRRKLLSYIKNKDLTRYKSIVAKLDLRG